jgi:peptidoglycan/LPS O-acetylase OafA/YrhL
MPLISNLAILPVLLIALGLVYPIARGIGIEAIPHRYSSIDGLRGFLALFVFLHHASIWFYVTHYHRWGQIPSYLYDQFGSTSVAFFFMITAFLFFSKLLEARGGKMDWLKFYVSRTLRIMPLYLFVITCLFLLVAFSSGFILKEPLSKLFWHLGQWALFMEPDINQLKGTRYLISGVQWSLAFEWLFYCSLASIGSLFFRIKTTIGTMLLTFLGLVVLAVIIDQFYQFRIWGRLSAFLSGIAAAFLSRDPRVRKFATNSWITPALLVLLYITLFMYRSLFSLVPYVCASVVFIAIACGNSFFGILILPVSRLLGQISYSVYLLHGLLLFITFHILISPKQAENLSPLGYWCITGGICAVLTLLTCLTYILIERPCLNSSNKVTLWLRSLFARRPRSQALPNEDSEFIPTASRNSVPYSTVEQDSAK